MKRMLLVGVLLLGVVLVTALPAAAAGMPAGSCPQGYALHDYMTDGGDMDMDHLHAGLTVDLNGDGYICMKEVTPTVHVHVDNTLP